MKILLACTANVGFNNFGKLCHVVFSCLEFVQWIHLEMTNYWQRIELETVR